MADTLIVTALIRSVVNTYNVQPVLELA